MILRTSQVYAAFGREAVRVFNSIKGTIKLIKVDVNNFNNRLICQTCWICILCHFFVIRGILISGLRNASWSTLVHLNDAAVRQRLEESKGPQKGTIVRILVIILDEVNGHCTFTHQVVIQKVVLFFLLVIVHAT